MNLRFLDGAVREIQEAAQRYEEQASGLGEQFVNEVEGCAGLLQDLPKIGRGVGEFRWFPLRKFPFALIYEVQDDDLIVAAVSHHRRRPGYWLEEHGR